MSERKNKGKIVVMKFGGSSVAKPKQMWAIAEYIKMVTLTGKKVVVVLSARGDTTDELIGLAEAHLGGSVPVDSRGELNKLLVTGEEQSAPLLALALRKFNVQAVSLTSREINLEASESGRVKAVKSIKLVKDLLSQEKVVIVTGFQGVIGSGLMRSITTLGRGGSDVTAVCLAAALGAGHCENHTDVDGIYSTDPRIVPNAKRFDKVSYQQLIQMASAGGGKLAKRAVILAQNLGVEIKVMLSPSFDESTGGTLVCSGSTLANIEAEESQSALAVQKLNIIKVVGISNTPGSAGNFFSGLRNINLKSSVQAPTGDKDASISILFSPDLTNEVKACLIAVQKDLMPGIKIRQEKTVAVLTLVDPLMEEYPGYLSLVCEALGEVGVNIISQSSPGITIEVMVDFADRDKAAMAIAKKFGLVNETE